MSAGRDEHDLTVGSLLGTKRRVDQALSVSVLGSRWSVAHLRGVKVGDLVLCFPAPQGDALLVRAESELPPGTWASRFEPSHSHPRTCPPHGSHESSGTGTTWNEPAHECSCPGPHAGRTPQMPPCATPGAHMHSRTSGTASEAPASYSISIQLAAAPERHPSPTRGKKGIRRSQAALRISIEGSVAMDELYVRQSPSQHGKGGICLELLAEGTRS